MIHISEAIRKLNDNSESHDVVFVSLKKGAITRMTNVVVLSSNYERKKANIKSIVSGQIRWMYYVLLIEIDGMEVYQ